MERTPTIKVGMSQEEVMCIMKHREVRKEFRGAMLSAAQWEPDQCPDSYVPSRKDFQ